ncbi:hypothetical protein PG988_010899 [Apiospora saccharicola]
MDKQAETHENLMGSLYRFEPPACTSGGGESLCGKHTDNYYTFNEVLTDLGLRVFRSDAMFELQRYYAIFSLYHGRYDVAAAIFEKLLGLVEEDTSKVIHDTETQIRRDLALVYAHLGYYTLAHAQLDRAWRSISDSGNTYGGVERKWMGINLHGQVKIDLLHLTCARIDRLWGMFKSALSHA